MIRPALARKYARALVASAAKRNVLSKVVEQVTAPARLAASDPELQAFLESVAFPEAAKRNVIDTILERLYPREGGGVDPITRNFFEALQSHHRLSDYLAIVAVLAESVDESEGVWKAIVTTATALSPEDQKVLMGALARATLHPVRLELAVNPRLLGGVVTQIGSTIYDGSVKTRLQKMKQQMVEGA